MLHITLIYHRMALYILTGYQVLLYILTSHRVLIIHTYLIMIIEINTIITTKKYFSRKVFILHAKYSYTNLCLIYWKLSFHTMQQNTILHSNFKGETMQCLKMFNNEEGNFKKWKKIKYQLFVYCFCLFLLQCFCWWPVLWIWIPHACHQILEILRVVIWKDICFGPDLNNSEITKQMFAIAIEWN